MKRAYLLVYNDLVGFRSHIKNWADSSSLVTTWRSDLPHCFYLVSEASAAELCEDLRSRLGRNGRFLFAEVSENRQGFLPEATWYLLRNKQLKRREGQ